MSLPAGLPPIPTATVGSYALPGWYLLALDHVRHGELGETDVRELVEDASAAAISDQERAGLDVVSDGEVRRADFIMGFYDRLHGLRRTPPHRRLGAHMYDSTPVYETEGRVTAPDGLGCVAEYEFAAGRTARPVKVAVPGPLTLTNAIRVRDGYAGREELAEALAEIVAAELRALVAAGCRLVQVDEPSFSAYWADPFANREMAEADEWARHDLPQVLAAGVVDVKSFHRERPEDVAGRLRRILDAGVPAERLWAVPDCGLWETPRWLAFRKLQALAAGAELVRQSV